MEREAMPGRILVVDDQEPNIQLISSTLGQIGFKVVSVNSGARALEELAAQPADLVLLDVLMPAMDGFEVCRRIRLHPQLAEIPIIFLSAADDKTFIVRALEAGAIDYVTKPFNRAELISRVRTHVALKQARDRLKQLAEDKDELLGILAHDLKNHLGGMQMSAQLMHDRALSIGDQRLKRMSANILDASDQMFSFVQEFLANAAADHGQAVKLEPVSITDSATAALKRYAEAARRKAITLHAALPGEAPLVLADRGALDQVIDNLVSNAVKFSPPDKSIWVTVQETDARRVECRVKDQGPGCDQDDLAHMFTRYRRLTARPTAGEPSTGLGLSIAKLHVDAMNGTLHCESQPGEGAVFVLRLPVAS
jgi:two-component system sensor histidine kinase/response regulator